MANEEHLAILKKGVEAWNKWRDKHPTAEPNLWNANLVGQELSHANFKNAFLVGADFTQSALDKADFIDADLRGANFSHSNLSGARFLFADLSHANFSWAELQDSDFSGATIGNTIFGNNDLQQVKGLKEISHWLPSILGTNTLFRSRGKLPKVFLRGCGLGDWEIEAANLYQDISPPQIRNIFDKLNDLRFSSSLDVPSCFISYSSKNKSFATRLHSDLQNKGVRCWFAPEDLKIGEKIRVGIDESIYKHDKLLLVLSKYSVESEWVEKEVETAMEKERKQKRTVLFPIMLDNSVLKVESGWPADIRRTRHIGDFTGWKDHDSYQKAFDRLLRDLKAEESK